MSADKYSPLTLRVSIGDLEIYTSPDVGFVGRFAVTPKTHSHPYYEIIAVIDGEMRIALPHNDAIELDKGELCVIPPRHYHSTSRRSDGAKMLAIRFSYGEIKGEGRMYEAFSSAIESVSEPMSLNMPDGLSKLLLDLRREMTEKGAAWEFMCRSILQRVFIEIFRLLSNCGAPQPICISDDSKHSRYYRIEMWFAENFAKRVTEGDLAREISISKRQLSRVFADIYGMSFREKLIEVRLHRAAQLLEQTDLNVEEIASAVGYLSFSGFHRAFVKYFDCTPFEYKKQNKGEV